MKKLNKYIFAIVILGTLFSGCKKFLDINQNPNNPDDAAARLLLPTAQAAISMVVGNNFQVYGGIFSQYWTQSPQSSQYKAIDRYVLTSTGFDRSWSILYANALQNLQLIIERNEPGITQHKAIAYILKGYTLQLATDAFGNVPSSEAASAVNFGNPKYDPQSQVYDSIFANVKRGLNMINSADPTKPASEDLIFKGNMDDWKAFANTLLLRAYLRISKVDKSKASQGIQGLFQGSTTFLSKDASMVYTSSGGNENPLYAEIVGLGKTQNLVASKTIVEAFAINSDPRRFSFYDKLPGQDTIAYIPQGAYNDFTTKRVSPPSALVGASAQIPSSATAPAKLISASESSFLQAEAIARGFATGQDDSLFAEGVRRSFVAAGLTNTLANTYLNTANDAVYPTSNEEDKIKAIITQKYYAMTGFQGFEAWTEWRRTGYPSFLTLSKATSSKVFPARLLYPNTEITSNLHFTNHEYSVIDIFQPVWWAGGTR